MTTRICDEVPERPVYRDKLGTCAYGGIKGINYTFQSHTGYTTEILFNTNSEINQKANGLTDEVLLAVLIDRLTIANATLPCRENERALDNMKDALSFLESKNVKLNTLLFK